MKFRSQLIASFAGLHSNTQIPDFNSSLEIADFTNTSSISKISLKYSTGLFVISNWNIVQLYACLLMEIKFQGQMCLRRILM